MLTIKESVLSLNEKQNNIDFPTFKLPHVLKICYDSPVKYYFGRF